jgi:hypothetical protein
LSGGDPPNPPCGRRARKACTKELPVGLLSGHTFLAAHGLRSAAHELALDVHGRGEEPAREELVGERGGRRAHLLVAEAEGVGARRVRRRRRRGSSEGMAFVAGEQPSEASTSTMRAPPDSAPIGTG